MLLCALLQALSRDGFRHFDDSFLNLWDVFEFLCVLSRRRRGSEGEALFDLLIFTQKKRHSRSEGNPHSEESTPCSNCNKNEGPRQSNTNPKKKRKSSQTTHSQSFFRNFSLSLTSLLPSFLFSHHIPLLKSHSPSMFEPVGRQRKRLSHRCDWELAR